MSSPREAEGNNLETQDNEAQDELYNQIFGGDGSDLSDDEDVPVKRLAFPKRNQNALDDDDEDEDEDERVDRQDDEDATIEASDEEDRYVPATARIPTFKKKRSEDAGDDESGDDQAERKKRKKKKKRRIALEERIDAIGKKAKVIRRKKKGDDEMDVVDNYHDEICARLRDRMLTAADKDEAANKVKMPGTAKLAMLDEVMGVLRNTTLWQSIVDNGVLEAVKRWLEPLPDRSLPSVGIQKALFEILPKMDLDTTTLKECRLGPIVLFYTKTKRVTPAISRQADALVQAWSRPIIKRPANYRSRYIETQNEVEQSQGEPEAAYGTAIPRKIKRFDVRRALEENAHRKGARVQIVKDVQYTVAPEPKTQHHVEEMQHVSRIQQDNKKFNKFARQLKARK
nr:transcription factor IWS1 [Cryptococcus depauperatus CBS 7841]